MRSLQVGITLWIAVACIAGAQEPLPSYNYQEAAKHIGEKAMVRGRIVATRNTGKICFLNFNQNYREHLSLVIYGDNFSKFPSPPETFFKDKDVEVTGKITEYQGRPQIVVSDPSEIKIVQPASAPMPAAELPVSTSAGAAPALISWKDAHRHINAEAVVEGRIVDTRNIGKFCFLNFHQDYQTYLTAVIPSESFTNFPAPPEQFYLDKNVKVKGRIELFRGRPEIKVSSPSQIEVLPPGAVKAEAATPIDWKDASKHTGTRVSVEGLIARAYRAEKAIFLSFDPASKEALTFVIFESDFGAFPSAPEKQFLNKKVKVTGIVQSFKGQPEIILNTPSQVEITDN